ncbi:DMT family transporter [Oricola sp.]|uniref:DMT family transporter n=1 Tax=Oricola sp. TaxID=1979950 RepID=UPI003BAC3131
MSDRSDGLRAGVIFGFLGMLGFSGTLVATRLAIADFSPLEITCARIAMAGALGAAALFAAGRTALPTRHQLRGILAAGLGLAVGYPFFLALALQSVPAIHGAMATGLAPAVTAILAVLRAGERPPALFWLGCAVGFCAVFYYAFDAGGGRLHVADLWLLCALAAMGFAYVEGGKVSAELGGANTLSWAMVLLTPGAIAILVFQAPDAGWETAGVSSWAALAYLGIISMFLASVFWYRGLAMGGIARIGQINLLMPIVSIALAALILGEEITTPAIITAFVVFAAMLLCLRSRVRRAA